MNKKQRIYFFISSFLLGGLFLYFSFLTNKDVFRDADYSSMVFLQKVINYRFDSPFSFLTLLGSTEITLLIFTAIFLGILLKEKRLFLGLSLYLTIFITEIFGKLLVFHPEPLPIFNRYSLNFHFPSSFVVHTGFSFPSGHMARTSFFIVILAFILLKSKKISFKNLILLSLLIVLLISIFISRIYLGEHWLSDVIGGLLLGSAVANLAIAFW